MAHFIQQTGYTLTELVKMVEESNEMSHCNGKGNPGKGTPVGLLLNEIGVIFHTSDADSEEHASAESYLRKIMKDVSQYKGNRATAYFYLRHPDSSITEATTVALNSFEKESKNARFVEEVHMLQNSD